MYKETANGYDNSKIGLLRVRIYRTYVNLNWRYAWLASWSFSIFGIYI